MADSKITALTSISTSTDPANDPLVIVDVSDTSMAATGTTKKVTLNQLLGASGTATLASATITGDLTVDTSTLKVDSANNRVGVVNASPSFALDVNGAGSGVSARISSGSGTGFRFDTTRNISGLNRNYLIGCDVLNEGWFSIVPSTALGGGTFTNPIYNASYDGIHAWSDGAGSERMRLNSTGLGVGRGPLTSLDVYGANKTNGNENGTLNVSSSDSYAIDKGGSIGFFGKYNSSSGNACFARAYGAKENSTDGSFTGYFGIATSPGGTPIERFRIDSSGNVGIGVTPSAGKGCLQLSSGINFPATQVASSDANTLDDYEEGTFTPKIEGLTTAGVGTYGLQSGKYTKVGNLVTFQVFVTWTAHTGTGNMIISGLPFTNGSSYWSGSIGFSNNISLTAGKLMTGYVEASSAFVNLQQYPTGGGATAGIPIDTAGEIMFSASYTV